MAPLTDPALPTSRQRSARSPRGQDSSLTSEVGGFTASNLTFLLTIPNNTPSLTGSVTPISGVLVSAQTVPEPSMLWVFLAVTAGPLAYRLKPR